MDSFKEAGRRASGRGNLGVEEERDCKLKNAK